MSWTSDEWTGFCHLLEGWWKDELSDGKRLAWKIALDDVDPVGAVATLKQLLRRGETWRPSVAEFVMAFEHGHADPVLTFDEAWPVVLGALRRMRPGDPHDSVIAAVEERAGSHVAGWVSAYGVGRLMLEPVDDPDHGGAVLHRLRGHYLEVMAQPASRDRLAARLSEGPRREGLRRFDPAGLLPEKTA